MGPQIHSSQTPPARSLLEAVRALHPSSSSGVSRSPLGRAGGDILCSYHAPLSFIHSTSPGGTLAPSGEGRLGHRVRHGYPHLLCQGWATGMDPKAGGKGWGGEGEYSEPKAFLISALSGIPKSENMKDSLIISSVPPSLPIPLSPHSGTLTLGTFHTPSCPGSSPPSPLEAVPSSLLSPTPIASFRKAPPEPHCALGVRTPGQSPAGFLLALGWSNGDPQPGAQHCTYSKES